jgi:hypothetical protein
MESKPEPEQTRPGDSFAVVADEIRGLGDDVGESMLKVLLELGKSNPGSTYVAAKKYVDQKGMSLCDFGNIGILGTFLQGQRGTYVGCPGDVVFYAQADRKKTDDILLVYYIDKKGFARLYHARALSFDSKGDIEVKELGGTKTYWVSRQKILGKLVGVVNFGAPDWHDLIGQIVDKEFLSKRLNEHFKWIEENYFEDKSERLAELKRRLRQLAVGSK